MSLFTRLVHLFDSVSTPPLPFSDVDLLDDPVVVPAEPALTDAELRAVRELLTATHPAQAGKFADERITARSRLLRRK